MKKLLCINFLLTMILCLASTASANAAKGEGLYMNFCSPCHASGTAGAPKVGDKAAWQSRIEKGEEAMTENAIKGFQGKTGFMPAKGGNSALTDEEVSFAVIYMLENSK